MPGIITHSIAFNESLEHLHGKKYRSHFRRSLDALFRSDEHRRAALFGALGPNIFDYWPFRKSSIPGSRLSFFLHDGGAVKLASRMLDRVIAAADFNNEWYSVQRAYFYGFVSHIICDSVFHPFVLYFSGFPSTRSKKETIHFREQNLMFQYNMDAYFEYYFRDRRFHLALEEMFPVTGTGLQERLYPSLKEFILGAIEESYPGGAKGLLWKRGKGEDTRLSRSFGYLDVCPRLIRAAYFLKRDLKGRFARLLRELRRKNVFYSDFLVPYPEARKINKHLMNLHRERWQHPAGMPGMRYESAEDLLRRTCDITTEVWEKTEGILFGQKKNYGAIVQKLSTNALTGHPGAAYRDLKVKDPVIIRI